ncbi:unnamed protein product [marine sediment metagenome]|uniref:Uncharacterized protein n=1 Tax=marine sediment metagenome TaxID=412755 RepID=X1FF53_9ZZZZ
MHYVGEPLDIFHYLGNIHICSNIYATMADENSDASLFHVNYLLL